jgi:hypothetical protein
MFFNSAGMQHAGSAAMQLATAAGKSTRPSSRMSSPGADAGRVVAADKAAPKACGCQPGPWLVDENFQQMVHGLKNRPTWDR